MGKKQKSKTDPFKSLKYIGYCRAFTPPGEGTSIQDFVKFAKFYLCRNLKVLWKDPKWEMYTDEEILIEYFAHLFSVDENTKKQFEFELTSNGTADYGEDVYKWLENSVKKNQKEMQQKLEEMPEKISFVPDKEDKEE